MGLAPYAQETLWFKKDPYISLHSPYICDYVRGGQVYAVFYFSSSVCMTVNVDPNGDPESVVCKDNVMVIYGALLQAMKDYTLDSRGDIGAWLVQNVSEHREQIDKVREQQDINYITAV